MTQKERRIYLINELLNEQREYGGPWHEDPDIPADEQAQKRLLRSLFNIRVEQKVEREEVAKVTGTNKDDTSARAPKKRTEKKVYPNDPCPCGSGKKYKQCCGRKQA